MRQMLPARCRMVLGCAVIVLIAVGGGLHEVSVRNLKVYAASPDVNRSIPECVTYCSRDKLGVSVAEIRWKVSDKPLAPEAMRSALEQQSLEVTVYKEGFEKDSFAILSHLAPGQRFTLRAVEGRPATLPGVQRLVLTEVATSREPTKSDLRLRNTHDGKAESVTAKVEGLEFGVNYFWRVRSGNTNVVSETVRCQAATCPVDYVNPRP